MSSTPARKAAPTTGASGRTPGLVTTSSTPSSRRAAGTSAGHELDVAAATRRHRVRFERTHGDPGCPERPRRRRPRDPEPDDERATDTVERERGGGGHSEVRNVR